MLDAAMVGAAVVAVLTQLIGLLGKRVGGGLSPRMKQLLALALATGLVNLSALHPFILVRLVGVDVTAMLNALVVWAVSTFLHDVATAVAPLRAAGVGLPMATGANRPRLG